jgi:preprotein translocase subunit SecA
MLNSLLTRVFGSRNERLLRQLQRSVNKINALEAEMQKLSDTELQAKTPEFQQRIQAGESLDKVLPELSPSAAKPPSACSACATTTCS